MTIPRLALPDFTTENAYYANTSVSVWTIDGDLEKTSTLATLYAAPTGGAQLSNPQTLDSRGRWPAPVYVAEPVIMTVTRGTEVIDSGIVGAMPRWRGTWATATLYFAGDRFKLPDDVIGVAVALETHTSDVFADDLAAELIQVEAQIDSVDIDADIPVIEATSAEATYGVTYTATSPVLIGTGDYFFLILDKPNGTGATLRLTVDGVPGTARSIRFADGTAIAKGMAQATKAHIALLYGSPTPTVRLTSIMSMTEVSNRIRIARSGGSELEWWDDHGDSFFSARVRFTDSGIDFVAGGTGAANDAVVVARAMANGDFRCYGKILSAGAVEVYHRDNPPPASTAPYEIADGNGWGPWWEGAHEAVAITSTDTYRASGRDLGKVLRPTAGADGGCIDFELMPLNSPVPQLLLVESAITLTLDAGYTGTSWMGTDDALTLDNTDFTSVAADESDSTFTFAAGNPVTETLTIGSQFEFDNLSEAANNGVTYTILGFSGTDNRVVEVYPPPTDMAADSAFTLTRVGTRRISVTGPGWWKVYKGQTTLMAVQATPYTTRATAAIATPDRVIAYALSQSWGERETKNASAGISEMLVRLGLPSDVLLIQDVSAGASAIVQYAPTDSNNYWVAVNGSGVPTGPGPRLTEAIAAIKATPGWESLTDIVMKIGLNDLSIFAATGVPPTASTPAIWKACALYAIAYMRAATGSGGLGISGLRVWVCPLPSQDIGTFDENLWYAMRRAQLDLVVEGTDIFRGPESYDLRRAYGDRHHTYAGQAIAGARLMRLITNETDAESNYLGPKIIAFARTAANTFKITIDRGVGVAFERPAVPAGFAIVPDEDLFGTPLDVAAGGYAWGTEGAYDTLTITTTTDNADPDLCYPYGSGWELSDPNLVVRAQDPDTGEWLPLQTYHPTV